MQGKLVGAYVDETLRQRIRRAAYEEDCSMAEVVRRALNEHLARRQKVRLKKQRKEG